MREGSHEADQAGLRFKCRSRGSPPHPPAARPGRQSDAAGRAPPDMGSAGRTEMNRRKAQSFQTWGDQMELARYSRRGDCLPTCQAGPAPPAGPPASTPRTSRDRPPHASLLVAGDALAPSAEARLSPGSREDLMRLSRLTPCNRRAPLRQQGHLPAHTMTTRTRNKPPLPSSHLPQQARSLLPQRHLLPRGAKQDLHVLACDAKPGRSSEQCTQPFARQRRAAVQQ